MSKCKHQLRRYCSPQLSFSNPLFSCFHTLGYLFFGGKEEIASPSSSSTLAGISPLFCTSASLSLYWGFIDKFLCQSSHALVCTSLSFATQLASSWQLKLLEKLEMPRKGIQAAVNLWSLPEAVVWQMENNKTWRTYGIQRYLKEMVQTNANM